MMRRHTPTLYAHPEQEGADEEGETEWTVQTSIPSRTIPSTNGSSSTRSRVKLRPKNAFPFSSSNLAPNPASFSHSPKYSDVYSQFLRRYRSEPGIDENHRSDPDNSDFQRGLGQLLDGGESDDDDLGRSSLVSGTEGTDWFPTSMQDSEPIQPQTMEERERLEWQTMLASVLDGDVLKSEKTRIAVALESSAEEQDNIHLNIWLGIQAKFSGRSESEERKWLEERRLRVVDAVVEEVNNFRVRDDERDTLSALKEVNAVLLRLDAAQSLYPTFKAFYLDNPVATQGLFQARCDTLYTWSSVFWSLNRQISLLQRWTGSETLDVSQPNTSTEIPIGTHPAHRGVVDIADGSSFVERVLKEDSIQKTFEKGFLTTVHAFIGTARDAQVNLASHFEEMNLPTFEKELIPLISFPTKLAQASLRLRLDYVQKIKDPGALILDQVTDDVKISLGLACTLKRQYEAFLAPDPGGKWNLPRCISEDYDLTILEALSVFFKLIHWKLKSGLKGIYFKETDLLEAQWATFNDVSMTVLGGSCLVAENLCALTNKLMIRVTNYFDTQLRVPTFENPAANRKAMTHGQRTKSNQMTDEEMVNWYSKILDNVRLRYRKLQRFARVLTQRFSNSAEYTLEGVALDSFIATLIATDHVLVYTQTYEEEGTYIVASSSIRERPDVIRQILVESFHVDEVITDETTPFFDNSDPLEREVAEAAYLLVLSPRTQFLWHGRVLMLQLPQISLDLKDNRVRLISNGPQLRLVVAKQQFAEAFIPVDEDGEPLISAPNLPTLLADQQAHLPHVNRELRKIARANTKLAESIVDSVHFVRKVLRNTTGCQELLENWYLFGSEHGQHAQKFMERASLPKFNRLLIKLAISWVSFICDDCDPTDRKTFRWAVNALEFTLHRTRRNNILQMPEDQFEMLRQKVASCMTLLISHFDILGARSTLEARKEKERQEELLRQQALSARSDEDPISLRSVSPDHDGDPLRPGLPGYIDLNMRLFWDKVNKSLREFENSRAIAGTEKRIVGRVLDDEKPEDRSLVFLASSSSNISIRWQQGRFIGAGAFGSVYLAVNLDSGSIMAVKEIKFQELSGSHNLYAQIKDELSVMEMLHHPNVVEYYGIEVHRDKVYIFEEYCQGGSLAALLEHGRIEDERIIQIYTLQMLEGLAYLHSKEIVHRDIKPDNILLDHLGVIKFVDFGASKILAKNQRSIQRSRRMTDAPAINGPTFNGLPGLGVKNSLTGTPMYMSPEVIKNDKRGRHGAMDIWSLGCVVLEFATGKKPWSNLDNEWAIMFHIGVATQHPPLPEPGQLSDLGINFIKQCLTIDPMKRPTAVELMNHPWMLEFREALESYGEAEMANSPPAEMPPEENYKNASVARQAAIMQEKETEAITAPTPISTPFPDRG